MPERPYFQLLSYLENLPAEEQDARAVSLLRHLTADENPKLDDRLGNELRARLTELPTKEQVFFLNLFIEEIDEAATMKEVVKAGADYAAGAERCANRLADLLNAQPPEARETFIADFLDELGQNARWEAVYEAPEFRQHNEKRSVDIATQLAANKDQPLYEKMEAASDVNKKDGASRGGP